LFYRTDIFTCWNASITGMEAGDDVDHVDDIDDVIPIRTPARLIRGYRIDEREWGSRRKQTRPDQTRSDQIRTGLHGRERHGNTRNHTALAIWPPC
jgi:hypothetical protein